MFNRPRTKLDSRQREGLWTFIDTELRKTTAVLRTAHMAVTDTHRHTLYINNTMDRLNYRASQNKMNYFNNEN